MVHCLGVNNVVADSLSRLTNTLADVPATPACHLPATEQPELLSPPPTPLNYAEMVAVQLTCPDMAALCASSSLSFITRDLEGQLLLGNVSTVRFWPLVPSSFRNVVFFLFTLCPIQALMPPNGSF